MKKKQTESLIQYVADVHDRFEEYEYDPLEVVTELEESNSKVSHHMEEIYEGLYGNKVCSICKNEKMFDEKNEEFYCPLHP